MGTWDGIYTGQEWGKNEKAKYGIRTDLGPLSEVNPEGVSTVAGKVRCQVGAYGLEDARGYEALGILHGVRFLLVDGDDVCHEGGAIAGHESPVCLSLTCISIGIY